MVYYQCCVQIDWATTWLFLSVFKQNKLIIEKLNVEHYHLKSYCSCLSGRATIAKYKCFNYTMNLKYLTDCKLSVNARGNFRGQHRNWLRPFPKSIKSQCFQNFASLRTEKKIMCHSFVCIPWTQLDSTRPVNKLFWDFYHWKSLLFIYLFIHRFIN